ncbi:MAG: RidA family protein [Pirellulales bacterium]|nr:RidA family protein [Pirellulales bacterium]
MSAETKLQELGLELPPPPKAAGLYRPLVVVQGLAYTSGHLPLLPDGSLITGRVGDDLDQQTGYDAARRAGLSILSTLRDGLGGLDSVKRVVRIFGVVQCTPEFTQQPAVINGCSELFRDVFGEEAGVGARSAVGTSALPLGAAVEIEAIFEIM